VASPGYASLVLVLRLFVAAPRPVRP